MTTLEERRVAWENNQRKKGVWYAQTVGRLRDIETRCLAARTIDGTEGVHQLWATYPENRRFVVVPDRDIALSEEGYEAEFGEPKWNWFRPSSSLPTDGPKNTVRFFDPEKDKVGACTHRPDCLRSADILEPRALCLVHGERLLEENLNARLSLAGGREDREAGERVEVSSMPLTARVETSSPVSVNPGRAPNTKLRRLSHSAVQEYLTCPRRFYYRYIEKLPQKSSGALVKGSACDRAWNYDLEQKIRTGEDLPLAEVLERTEQSFRDEVKARGGKGEIDWGDEGGPRPSLDSAMAMSRQWRLKLAPDIEPEAVQVEQHVTLASGRDFVAYLDVVGVVDGRRSVIDNKTARRRMPQQDADKNLQPTAYAFTSGRPIQFVFARAIDTGANQYSEIVKTQRFYEDIAWYRDLVGDVEKAMTEEVYPVNPTSNLCSPKFCSFWNNCPVGRARTVRTV